MLIPLLLIANVAFIVTSIPTVNAAYINFGKGLNHELANQEHTVDENKLPAFNNGDGYHLKSKGPGHPEERAIGGRHIELKGLAKTDHYARAFDDLKLPAFNNGDGSHAPPSAPGHHPSARALGDKEIQRVGQTVHVNKVAPNALQLPAWDNGDKQTHP